mgnify:CR=1 FL=1
MKKTLAFFFIFILFITGCSKKEPGQQAADTGQTVIRMETSFGVMTFKLYDNLVPETAGNFKKLIKEGFYDNQQFHRIIKDFMIQSGDPLTKDDTQHARWGTGGPGYTIKDEFIPSLSHTKKGLLSMANSGPNTGGSQFFITLAPTSWLDNKHAIFGELIEGEDVLDDIGNIQTNQQDRPVTLVLITKVTVVE